MEGQDLKGARTGEVVTREPIGSWLWRLWWLAVLVVHGLLGAVWWFLAPGGFRPDHPRFWTNEVAPIGIVIQAMLCLWFLHHERMDRLRTLLPGWPAAWAGWTLAMIGAFPTTMARIWLVPALVAVAMGLSAIGPWRRGGPSGRRTILVSLAGGLGAVMVGAGFACALRPPAAGTHPGGGKSSGRPRIAAGRNLPVAGAMPFSRNIMVQPSDGSLIARISPLRISVRPLLRFESRSPDGAPVVLVPAAVREGPEPRMRRISKIGDDRYLFSYDLEGQGTASLGAGFDPAAASLALDAASTLDRPVYSHLNAYCDVEVQGHHRLSLEFSPCPGSLFGLVRPGIPFGRPALFAYVRADRTFLVVEATSGEKGPFQALARGRLEPSDPLTITLHDEGRPVARLTLEDFAAQADTTLSPTAGWGVPVNAIEFALSDDKPSSMASIFITLSGTSVGRGWDCVAHRAGTYRNRLRLEPVRSVP